MAATPEIPGNPTVISVANAKGGVGKTSIVANAAGIAALAGWQVLAVDLDPQGNLATDLGYQKHSDLGASLATTLRTAAPPQTIPAVRPGLDVWAGGPALSAAGSHPLIPEVAHPLAEAIRSTGTTYDFVFIDCPPALGPLVDAGLTGSQWLLVPIRADHASLDGLRMITERFREVKTINPDLELLGVTLFDVSRSATAIVREVSAVIRENFDDIVPRLLPAIRRSERSAFDMRRLGLLAYEYEERYLDSKSIPLAERIRQARSGEGAGRYSAAAPGLANDYFELTKRVLATANNARSEPHRQR